jgi:hypothetical protein
LGYFYAKKKLCIHLNIKGLGYSVGDFFHKLIRGEFFKTRLGANSRLKVGSYGKFGAYATVAPAPISRLLSAPTFP